MSAVEQYTLVDEIARCEKWIKAALEYTGGTHEYIDVVDMLLAGRVQLWSYPNSMIITEFIVYPRQKHLNIWLAGGKLEECLSALDELEEFAANNDCVRMVLLGRDGWQRPLGRRGWSRELTSLTKEISRG